VNPIERLFCENLLPIHRRQRRFLAQINGAAYDFDPTTATLSDSSGATFSTQILGIESNGHWMWAWADSGHLQPATTVAAAAVKAFGEAHGLAELTTAKVELAHLRCGGYTLAAIASLAQGSQPFFRCVQPDGVAVFVLVTSVTLPDDAGQLTRSEVNRAIRDMFQDYAQADDILTLSSAMTAAGYRLELTDDAVIGHRGDEEPMRWERAWFAS
jgi:hypothetical protein